MNAEIVTNRITSLLVERVGVALCRLGGKEGLHEEFLKTMGDVEN